MVDSSRFNGENEKPLVIGLDKAVDLLMTTNTSRFPGKHYRDFFNDEDSNKIVDALICRFLDQSGFQCVFTDRLEVVEDLIKTEVCKVLLLHPRKSDTIAVVELLKQHPDILVIWLLNNFPASNKTEIVDGRYKGVFQADAKTLGVDIGDLALSPTDLIVGAPKSCMGDLIGFISERLKNVIKA